MPADASDTARIEAFSDGVFAIAITLLVLDLKVPKDTTTSAELARALVAQWPSYFAFLTSFATIGIMWINHHRLFTLIRRSDHILNLLNMLLLLGVTVTPFPTSLLAEYVGRNGEKLAAWIYSGTFVVISFLFNLLWHYAAAGRRLIGEGVPPAEVEAQSRQYLAGPLFYLIAAAVVPVSVPLCIAVALGLAVFFGLPFGRKARVRPRRAA